MEFDLQLSDQVRQEDEIFALQNIFDKSEFRYNKKINIECSFSISCNIMNEKLLIIHNPYRGIPYIKNVTQELYIKHLPPIRFYTQLPQDYPSKSAPQYHLAINWLPPWEASLVCQKLDELWQENEFNEILFVWLEFLKNELLSYLNLKDSLDVSYHFNLFEYPTNEFLLEVLKWTDHRVINGGLYLNPIERLLDYDEFGALLEFEANIQECGICFIAYSGKVCIKMKLCNHIFCKNCIVQFLITKIEERNVKNIECPALNCKTKFKPNQIEEFCSPELFEKYEKYLTEIKLISSGNLVYCPRRVCQASVIVKAGENLASCPECEYNFCAYCFKVYHGVMACDMTSEEKLKLIKEYENGSSAIKNYLEKRYGKNQIRQIAEKQLTNDYLKQNTKICPTCGVLTTKVSGCNLISCLHCHTHFCWICNLKIVSEDPYDHFKSTKNGPCVNRLHEGVDEINEMNNMIDDFDIIQNLELFFEFELRI